MNRLKRFFTIFIQPIIFIVMTSIIGSILILSVCLVLSFLSVILDDFGPITIQRGALAALSIATVMWMFHAWDASKEEK